MKPGFFAEARTIVAFAVCLLSLAEIVDLTIVAVAIPDIMGALSCNIDEISLVSTSYIVSAAIFIMLTGFVSNRFGCKKTIVISTIVFGISSVMCGLSTNLQEMIFFRIVQGLGGAFLPSMAQGYVVSNFDEKEQSFMMGILTLVVVLGPIIGPIMGGYLVEALNWRWIFFVNVPICLLSLFFVSIYMKETPVKILKFDKLSFIFMATGFGCLEYVIDEGNNNDWFSSHRLIIVFLVGIVSLAFFIWRGIYGKSVVSFKLFTNLNFIASCLYVFIFMGAASCVLTFFPTLMQNGYGFPVDLAGYITAPRGIFAVFGAGMTIQLCKRFDKRFVLYWGLSLFVFANYLQQHYGATWNLGYVLFAGAIQGMSMSATFVVLLQVAFTGLPNELGNDASGVFNFFRNIGSSVGTSFASTILSQQQQVAWSDMVTHVTPYAEGFRNFIQHAPQRMTFSEKINTISYLVKGQSFMVANIDLYFIASIISLILIILPFLLAKPKEGFTEVSMH